MKTYLDGLIAQRSVYYALVAFARRGRDALDLGAWHGDMSVILSRLIGPRGQIVAVEASRKQAEICQRNLVANGCHNVFLVNRAIWSDSNSEVTFREDDRWPQGGAISNASRDVPHVTHHQVKTVCVDDIVADFTLRPHLIKVDIEGAERAMLDGARQTITEHRPVLILEQRPDQVDIALTLTQKMHYRAVCLEYYTQIEDPLAFYEEEGTTNIAFIPNERFDCCPYARIVSEPAALLPIRDGLTEEFALAPGRYILRAAKDDRASLRGKPFWSGLSLSLDGTIGRLASWQASSQSLRSGHMFTIDRPDRATISLQGANDAARAFAGQISAFSLDRIIGAPEIADRYTTLLP